MKLLTLAAGIAAFAATGVFAAPDRDAVETMSQTMGEMAVPLPGGGIDRAQIDDALRFEPIQSFDEMFLRDDVVFLMRHGPTDWSKLDSKDVAPGDCANQRVLSSEGREDMRNMGALLAHNDIRFGRIVVSEWCRNQQTLDELEAGYDLVEPDFWGAIPTQSSADLNLLLALQGARDTSDLSELISNWDGGDGTGPLLIVSHFTNIQELTEFSVYEGEMLVLDPDRDNRVLGYVRLKSSGPDTGHFDVDDEAVIGEDGAVNEDAAAAAGPAGAADPMARN